MAFIARSLKAGFAVGAWLGVLGGLIGLGGAEFRLPLLIGLFDIKLAGSLSLAVSLPTMLVAFARYSRDGSIVVQRQYRRFVIAMAAG